MDTLAEDLMSAESTSLYRRHRPGSFDEVVGQQHVVRTLRNAVERDKVHHAYLFVGSRGTGKTSMAKILARSLNCERGGPTVTPCGECESCLTIAAGTSIDVIEMDAASNRSVDDVRDLRERVAYAPAGGHWKVYILDEAHMLTKEAWNAFLKTLEEPPPKTVFVLATTESHKVMATIADRCQRFDFQRPSLEQISEVLTRVAASESIEVEEGAVAMIARSAQGSFRDALGTLDQLVAFGGADSGAAQVGLNDVLEMLGAADAELLFDAVDAVAASDPKAVLLGVEKMARSGRDPSQLARDLLAHLRFLLVAQTTGEVPPSFVVTATDEARLQAQASAVGPATLVRTIDELADALTAVREGDDARMAVEIALLKAARPDLDPNTEGLLRRIEKLESQLGGGGAAAVPPPPPAGNPVPAAVDPPVAEEEEAEQEAAVEPEAAAQPESPAEPDPEPPASVEEPPVSAGDLSLEEISRIWPTVLAKLGETAPALAATFEGARPVAFGEEGLQIGFPADKTFNKKKAESPERREAVAAAFEAVAGQALKPTYVLLEGEEEPAAQPQGEPAAKDAGVDEDELMERLKNEFDAEEVS
ncbi:MAG TPA: DNA polymerase III subunit gamma/tau [Solirubrobacterales bacterium]|nr:DNA polymerase III subunit gamma/tau [Solirubrobacterales bacterium]